MLRATVQELRSSPEADSGWESYLHDMNELPDEKNRTQKAARGHEYTLKALFALCAGTAQIGSVDPKPPFRCIHDHEQLLLLGFLHQAARPYYVDRISAQKQLLPSSSASVRSPVTNSMSTFHTAAELTV